MDQIRQMWKVSYVDFDQSVCKVLDQDPTFIDFDQITDIYDCDFETRFLKK